MRRKQVLVTTAILGTTAAAVFGVLFLLFTSEPDFYATAPEPGGYETSERASKLVTRIQDLKNDIRSKPEWGASFNADDLNCFFRENMAEGSGLAGVLPRGFHSPRVVADGDKLKLGMRYGHGTFSSVFWVEVRAWLVKDETNLIALELCGMSAGAVPVGCQSLLDSITEAAHDANVDVTWYRHAGNPVGVFRFYADQMRPATQIHTFQVANGTVIVAGRTRTDPGAGNPPPGGATGPD